MSVGGEGEGFSLKKLSPVLPTSPQLPLRRGFEAVPRKAVPIEDDYSEGCEGNTGERTIVFDRRPEKRREARQSPGV